MSRKLAHIEKIVNIEPIEGKDKIELATVLAWKVIVEKDQFKIGDLCVFIEPDSILPTGGVFEDEILRKRCFSSLWNGFRIKSIKMCGIYSQGICYNIEQVLDADLTKYPEGKDVTELLKIRKYDPEALVEANSVKRRKIKNPILRFLLRFNRIKNIFFPKHKGIFFPSHLISKTDEERIQNVPWILEKYATVNCYITEKVDGCSASYVWDKKKFLVCSRSRVNQNKNSHYNRIAIKYNLAKVLKGTGYAIQGEIVGNGVGNGSGKNLYNTKGNEFYVYNIIDTKTRTNLPFWDIEKFCENNGLKMVPILETNYSLGTHNVQEILEMANGKSKLADVLREGIIIRDEENLYRTIAHVGSSLSFKAISPDFELKYLNRN